MEISQNAHQPKILLEPSKNLAYQVNEVDKGESNNER